MAEMGPQPPPLVQTEQNHEPPYTGFHNLVTDQHGGARVGTPAQLSSGIVLLRHARRNKQELHSAQKVGFTRNECSGLLACALGKGLAVVGLSRGPQGSVDLPPPERLALSQEDLPVHVIVPDAAPR